MSKRLSLILVPIIFLSMNYVFSQTEFYPKNTIDIKLFGGKTSASSYFDIEGSQKLQLPDTTVTVDEEARDYRFNYDELIFGIRGEYAPTEGLVLFAEMPLVFYSLTETTDKLIKIEGDTITQIVKVSKGDFSLTQPAYIALGGRYKFYSKKAYTAVLGELRIPPGFHDGVQHDTSAYPFLSDGAFEFHSGLLLGVKFEKAWLESSFSYLYKAEDLFDAFLVHTEAGVSTVPGSKLMGYLNFSQSIAGLKDAELFNPERTTLQEHYLNGGVYFQLFVSKIIYVEFTYKINLLGKNSMIPAGYLIGCGVRF